jgi:hypothetical protein
MADSYRREVFGIDTPHGAIENGAAVAHGIAHLRRRTAVEWRRWRPDVSHINVATIYTRLNNRGAWMNIG